MSNIKLLLEQSEKELNQAGISTARLDCLVLLEDVTGKNRSWLLAHPDFELESSKVKKLNEQIERRANHEPLAYIRGRSAFYGRDFLVTADTLQPRPETETMIELLLDLAKSSKLKAKSLIDVGTGSGCIAITAKLELPDANVYATDISQKCLEVAEQNASTHDANVKLYQGNLLKALPTSNFQLPTSKLAILANLPYVPAGFTINQAAMFEPETAIFGGQDGLDYYRELFAQIDELNIKPRAIFTESLPTQHENLRAIAEEHGFKQQKSQDFIQVFVRG